MKKVTYKDSGVNIESADLLVENIKTMTNHSIGDFGGFFELPSGYKTPVLVSGTDGVGTKLKLVINNNSHNTIGIDLVAMCVNDVICSGAKPLYFLDYYATGKLDVDIATQVMMGIAQGCIKSEVALIGGETAEMPVMYKEGDYDLAGFCTGVVEKDKILGKHKVQVGDLLVGIASSGLHANGYSLVNKLIEDGRIDINNMMLRNWLLAPTNIYVKVIQHLINRVDINAIAHITGGGFANIDRIIPDNAKAFFDTSKWNRHMIFDLIQKASGLSDIEMMNTFNCGIGMVIAVSPEKSMALKTELEGIGVQPWLIGKVINT